MDLIETVLAAPESEYTPQGKRTVRRTVRGSLNGYVGKHFWICFGEAFDPAAQRRADDWAQGKE